jgi:23S rRNA (uracil1939-C5)-methyltransferase
MVVTPKLRKLQKKISHALIKASKKPESEVKAHTSERPYGLRYVVARQSKHTGNVLLCFVVTDYSEEYEEIANRLVDSHFGVVSVSLHFNKEPGNAIFSRNERGYIGHHVLAGGKVIEERVNGLRYRIGVGDFFQVNPTVAAHLQDEVVAASMEYHGQPVVDLYSGVGFFALALSRKHETVLGVEQLSGAVERANENATLNGMRTKFISSPVEDTLDQFKKGWRHPFIVIDPARRGLEAGVSDAIQEMNPCAIAYVSCNPRTLAKDVREFAEKGWRIKSLKAYDMIPQSSHTECMVLLESPNRDEQKNSRKPLRWVCR